jgi:hypothetical protein
MGMSEEGGRVRALQNRNFAIQVRSTHPNFAQRWPLDARETQSKRFVQMNSGLVEEDVES